MRGTKDAAVVLRRKELWETLKGGVRTKHDDGDRVNIVNWRRKRLFLVQVAYVDKGRNG